MIFNLKVVAFYKNESGNYDIQKHPFDINIKNPIGNDMYCYQNQLHPILKVMMKEQIPKVFEEGNFFSSVRVKQFMKDEAAFDLV